MASTYNHLNYSGAPSVASRNLVPPSQQRSPFNSSSYDTYSSPSYNPSSNNVLPAYAHSRTLPPPNTGLRRQSFSSDPKEYAVSTSTGYLSDLGRSSRLVDVVASVGSGRGREGTGSVQGGVRSINPRGSVDSTISYSSVYSGRGRSSSREGSEERYGRGRSVTPERGQTPPPAAFSYPRSSPISKSVAPRLLHLGTQSYAFPPSSSSSSHLRRASISQDNHYSSKNYSHQDILEQAHRRRTISDVDSESLPSSRDISPATSNLNRRDLPPDRNIRSRVGIAPPNPRPVATQSQYNGNYYAGNKVGNAFSHTTAAASPSTSRTIYNPSIAPPPSPTARYQALSQQLRQLEIPSSTSSTPHQPNGFSRGRTNVLHTRPGGRASGGGVGSSRGPRAFSAREQGILWAAWNAGDYYPSHTLVDQMVHGTTLSRPQIRGWYVLRFG